MTDKKQSLVGLTGCSLSATGKIILSETLQIELRELISISSWANLEQLLNGESLLLLIAV